MFLSDRKQVEDWKKNLKNREISRRKVSWREPPLFSQVKYHDIKVVEYAFNPILQTSLSVDPEILMKIPFSFAKGMDKKARKEYLFQKHKNFNKIYSDKRNHSAVSYEELYPSKTVINENNNQALLHQETMINQSPLKNYKRNKKINNVL